MAVKAEQPELVQISAPAALRFGTRLKVRLPKVARQMGVVPVALKTEKEPAKQTEVAVRPAAKGGAPGRPSAV